MTTVTLEIDDQTLARVEAVARARKTSVENLLKARAEEIARLAPLDVFNPGHREILAPLNTRSGDEVSERERSHDRDLARAETYAANRARLLELIDSTEGDLGGRGWDRERVYER